MPLSNPRCSFLVAILLAASLAPAATVSIPASVITPYGDGEDTVPTVYYSLDTANLQLSGDPEDRVEQPWNVLLIEVWEDPSAEAARVPAPRGRYFDADRLRISDDASVAILPLLGEPAQVLFVDLASARVLLTADAARVRFKPTRVAVDTTDAALIQRLGAIRPRPAWRDQIWPIHLEQIQEASVYAGSVVSMMTGENVDAAARRDLDALLAAPAQAADEAGLLGDWRVRSLQGAPDSLYAYPWFKAQFFRDRDGLGFCKTTGSQRRSGRLWPNGDGESLVFIGASTVNEEPERRYSFIQQEEGPSEHDSVGRLWELGPGHLMLILDAQPGLGFEIYELRRP